MYFFWGGGSFLEIIVMLFLGCSLLICTLPKKCYTCIVGFFSPLCKTSPSLLFEGGEDDIRLSLFFSVYRRSTKPNFGVFKTEKKSCHIRNIKDFSSC